MPFWFLWKKTQHETLLNLWVVSHQRGRDTSAHRPGIAALSQVWQGLFFQPRPLGLRVTEDFPSRLLIPIKSRWHHSESALSGDFSVAARAKKVLRLGGVSVISWTRGAQPTIPAPKPCQTAEPQKSFEKHIQSCLQEHGGNWTRQMQIPRSSEFALHLHCLLSILQNWLYFPALLFQVRLSPFLLDSLRFECTRGRPKKSIRTKWWSCF